MSLSAGSRARTYYEVLGVPEDASSSEIERAWRQKAREWHPDVNRSPEAHERMVEINEAKAVLLDPELRTRYDDYLNEDGDDLAGDFDPDADDWFTSDEYRRASQEARKEADVIFKKVVTIGHEVASTIGASYLNLVWNVLAFVAVIAVMLVISIGSMIACPREKTASEKAFDEASKKVYGAGNANEDRSFLPQGDASRQSRRRENEQAEIMAKAVDKQFNALLAQTRIGRRGSARYRSDSGIELVVLRLRGSNLRWEVNEVDGTRSRGILKWLPIEGTKAVKVLPLLSGMPVSIFGSDDPVFEIPDDPRENLTLRSNPSGTYGTGDVLAVLHPSSAQR